MAQMDRDNIKEFRPKGNDTRQSSAAADEADYQKHFRSTYRFWGYPFESYLPAYHFAAERSEEAQRGTQWNDVEGDLHKDWERSHPGTWSRFREAIHYGWEKNHKR